MGHKHTQQQQTTQETVMSARQLTLYEKIVATLIASTCFMSLLTLQGYISDTRNKNLYDKRTLSTLAWVRGSFATISIPTTLICCYQRHFRANERPAPVEDIPLITLQHRNNSNQEQVIPTLAAT